jgi:single-stranded DNA-binding protein
MSFFALVAGTLAADPQQRTGASGKPFTTATLRDDEVLTSIIAFGALAEELLAFRKGDGVAIGGRGKLNAWVDRDGVEKHGLSITVSTIAAPKPPPRPRARPAVRKPARPRDTALPLADDPVDDLWRGAP